VQFIYTCTFLCRLELGKWSNRRTGVLGTRLQSTVATRMVVDGPRTVSHDPGIVTGSKGLLLDVGLDHSLLLVIDRFDGNGDVITA
jgi:hypothetical protein